MVFEFEITKWGEFEFGYVCLNNGGVFKFQAYLGPFLIFKQWSTIFSF